MRQLGSIAVCSALICAVAVPATVIAAPNQSQHATVLHTYRKSTAMEVINAIPVDVAKVLPLLPDGYDFLPAAAVGLGDADQALVVIANFQGSHPQIDDQEPATADQVAIDLAILVQEPALAAVAGLDIPGAFHVYTIGIYTNDAPYAATLEAVGMPVELVPDIIYDRPMDDLTGVGDLAVTVPLDDAPFYSHNTGFGYAPAAVLNAILWHNGNRGTAVLHFMDEPTELGEALSLIYTEPGSSLHELLDGGGLGPGPIDPNTGFESVIAPSLNYRYREGSFGRLLLIVPEPASLALLALALLFLVWRSRWPLHACCRDGHAPLATLLVVFLLSSPAPADIFQWEYINPADPSQGKQQSATLAPDGAGVNAEPGANLSNRDLTMAYLIAADLSPYIIYDEYGYETVAANLTGANLNQADLTNAILTDATLANANLSQAILTNAYLVGATLTDANLTDADLTSASFNWADLTRANLTGAEGRGADFSYGTIDNADFSQANLRDAFFTYATLSGANFTQAEVRGAVFSTDGDIFGTGFTAAQLYSTASYQAGDLTGINLIANNLSGVNLAGQNLTNARLSGAFDNADFSQANLTNAELNGGGGGGLTDTITGANLTGAEVRGATISGITLAQLYTTASYQMHDLTRTHLRETVDWMTGTPTGDFSGANFVGQNLTNATLWGDLTNANFSQANLTNADLSHTLTGANLTGAEVRGATLSGITAAQLYSTVSYQAHDLSGITFIPPSGSFIGVNLIGQNLTNAVFLVDDLSHANLTQSTAMNTSFRGVTLSDANLSQANLTNATFHHADLTGADLTMAEVRGASFHRDGYAGSGITAAQLYSTASYQGHDLTGINLERNNLYGVDLAGQNLTNASFSGAMLTNANFSEANLTNADFSTLAFFFFDIVSSDLTGANLSHANLTNAKFNGNFFFDENGYGFWSFGANLTGADLSGSDTRGANFLYAFAWPDDPITTNLIQPDGHIAGLDLTAGELLVVRDYDGNPNGTPSNGPLSISVEEYLTMDATGTLRLVFDADHWDSTISFAPGIPVALGGTLELTFAPDVDVATQSGRTIDLFDWTGVTPTGAFTVSSPYAWDLSQLYTTGEVTLALAPQVVPGDFNGNGTVDAADYTVWRNGLGTTHTPDDYDLWKDNFGAVAAAPAATSTSVSPIPEPSAVALLLVAALPLLLAQRRSSLRV